MQKESPIREPLILGDKSYHDITVDVAKPVLAKANKMWWIVFGISLVLFVWWILSVGYTVGTGIGVWGLNKTVGWAWDITNFVWWVGIAVGIFSSIIHLPIKEENRVNEDASIV